MIAIISDVHGNYPALKSVLNEIDAMECRTIVSLGDIAGYYCMINQCVEILRSRGVIHLMGNHDDCLVSGSRFPRSNSANRCLDYQSRVITDKNLQWLSTSPVRLDFDDLSLVHGGWRNPLDEYLYDVSEEYFAGLQGKFFISGHTHIQRRKEMKGKFYCNPGSVGQPRDGDPRAAYAIFDRGSFILKRVEYNISSISAEMDKAGFDAYIYQNLYSGSRIGQEVDIVTAGSEQNNGQF